MIYMELQSPQKELYSKDRLTALQAQRLAEEIAFGPVVFQVSRLMIKFGILQLLDENKNGLTIEEISEILGDNIRFTLDIKQCVRSGVSVFDMLKAITLYDVLLSLLIATITCFVFWVVELVIEKAKTK